MTDREKAIVMAHTGICMLAGEKIGVFHAYIEDIMGRPVYTHELAIQSISDEIKEKSRDDFMKLCMEEQEPCEDTISRQAVLDLIEHYNSDGLGSLFYGYEDGVKFADKVKKLPPITSQEPCEDVIRREDAINAVSEALEHVVVENEDVARKMINKLPSVTPQPKTRWIPVTERLPEDGTWNLFTDGNMVSVERYKADAMDHFYPNGRWFSLDEAIAWMPLPKLESAYDKCPICVNRNKNCQFGSLDCHFEEQIDVAESENKG